MRTIFAEYNPQRNSIDIYHEMLAICFGQLTAGRAEKRFKNHSRLYRLCIDFTCSR